LMIEEAIFSMILDLISLGCGDFDWVCNTRRTFGCDPST